MADYRRVAVQDLVWFPRNRKTIPVTPVRVQVPPSRCAITLLPGRYSLVLTLAGHAAHAGFARFLRDVEAHAREHAGRYAPDLRWFSCVDPGAAFPSLKLSAFDDARFYAADGTPHASPPDIQSCSALLELSGAWTTDSAWGLRLKVLEVKETPEPVAVPCLFVGDDDAGFDAGEQDPHQAPARSTFVRRGPEPMFLDDP